MSKAAFLRELTEAIAERAAASPRMAPRGKPELVRIPGVGEVKAAPIREIDDAAEAYMRRNGIEGSHRIDEYPEFDPEFARRVASEYGDAKHAPGDPRVRRSYDQMIDETLAQYKALKDTGLDIKFLRPGEPDPYAASPSLGYHDIQRNGRLQVFPTDQGYGSSTLFDPAENPLLKAVGKVGDKHDAVANDAFRAVHDAYGHFGPGNPFFRAPGEDRAWQHHARMFSDEALPAMTAETRGQNSWLNYGPHGENNRTASSATTTFADQKAVVMPKWVIEKDLGRLIRKFGIAGASALLGYDVMDGLSEAQASELMNAEQGDDVGPKFAKGGAVRALMEAIAERAAPQKTAKAYKLFKQRDGKLYPLFVNANDEVPTNEWLRAEAGALTDKGQVKSKIGPLAYRPGWHAGDLPIATHIGGKSDPSLKAPDYRPDDQVWAEVDMADDVDWQSVANQRARITKAGKPDPKTAHITDQVPYGGHYRYKTNSNMTGEWMIGGDMRVNRILGDDEVEAINSAAGVADLPRLKNLVKKFGIAGASAALGYDVMDGLSEAEAAELMSAEQGDDVGPKFAKGGAVRALMEAVGSKLGSSADEVVAPAAEKQAMRLYHGTIGGTPKRYTEIKSPTGFTRAHAHQGFDELSPDQNWDQLGLHMGNPKQANGFAGLGAEVSDEDLMINPEYFANRVPDRGRVIPLDVEMSNPLRLEDRTGHWKPVEIYDQLVEQQKIVDDEDVRHQLWKLQMGKDKDQMSAMQQIREMIENAGHDGVVYLNRVEGLPNNVRLSALQRAEEEGFAPEKMTDDDFRKFLPDAQDSYITWNKDKYRSPFGEGTGAGWAEGGPVSPLQAAYRR